MKNKQTSSQTKPWCSAHIRVSYSSLLSCKLTVPSRLGQAQAFISPLCAEGVSCKISSQGKEVERSHLKTVRFSSQGGTVSCFFFSLLHNHLCHFQKPSSGASGGLGRLVVLSTAPDGISPKLGRYGKNQAHSCWWDHELPLSFHLTWDKETDSAGLPRGIHGVLHPKPTA